MQGVAVLLNFIGRAIAEPDEKLKVLKDVVVVLNELHGRTELKSCNEQGFARPS